MSDLFCPATLILARHGEAAYGGQVGRVAAAPATDDLTEVATWADEGTLTEPGRDQSAQLAERLASRNVALVVASPYVRAVQTAEIVADRLSLDLTLNVALQEYAFGDHANEPRDRDPFAETYAAWLAGDLDARISGGESGREVVDRLRSVLEEISDLYRGQTVLLVAHGGIIQLGCRTLARMAPGVQPGKVPPGGTVELQVDGDGIVCTAWG